MSVLGFILICLIAAICGAIGQAIAGYSLGGCLVSSAVGFIGALVGTWIARTLGLPLFFSFQVGTEEFPVIWAILGSAIFVMIVGLLTRRPSRY